MRNLVATYALVAVALACTKRASPPQDPPFDAGVAATASASAAPSTDEHMKPPVPAPASGKGTIAGYVTFNHRATVDRDVRLCRGRGDTGDLRCDEIGRTRTGVDGSYSFRDLEPGTATFIYVRGYGGWYSPTSGRGLASPDTITIVRDAVTVATEVSLTKDDLVVIYPRKGARVPATPTVRWAPYPDASAYWIEIATPFPQRAVVVDERAHHRAEYALTKPLTPGRWKLFVRAVDANGRVIASNRWWTTFIVPDADDPEPIDATAGEPRSSAAPSAHGDIDMVTPREGKGAIVGRVLFDDRPVPGIEVAVCARIDADRDASVEARLNDEAIAPACAAVAGRAKTDAGGVFALADVAPGEYPAVVVRRFDTATFRWATRLYMTRSYAVGAGKTTEAEPTHLWRSDLSIVAPAPNAITAKSRFEVRWNAYPGAAYYKLTIGDTTKSREPYEYEFVQVAEPRFFLDKPLANATYLLSVAAYSATDRRLSDNGAGTRFSVVAK